LKKFHLIIATCRAAT